MAADKSQSDTGSRPKRSRPGPHDKLRSSVTEALVALGIDCARVEGLAASLPRKWERLGDVVLLPEGACAHPLIAAALQNAAARAVADGVHGSIPTLDATSTPDVPSGTRATPASELPADVLPPAAAEAALAALAAALGVARLGVQAAIEPSLHRKSRVRLLWPPGASDGRVRHVENGVVHVFDLTRNMFASGNGTERMRVGRLGQPGEVVVDLYAGIGYFTLPYLVKARVQHVHACEWDEDAVLALRAGLEANGVANRCTVHAGDNALALAAFEGRADRVNLGLIPSSEAGWPLAVRALRPEGGWLHVHANVSSSEEGRACWLAHLTATLGALSRGIEGRQSWAEPTVVHVERVKGYAPRIDHLVADVRLGPPPACAPTSR